MKKLMEIHKNEDYDRIIFLFIDESRKNEYADGIIGINFHQGIDEILMEFAEESNPMLTEIWRRITLNYPNVDYHYLINQAIELYIDAFITQPIKI
jgi:hypothetical protein